MEVQRFPDDPAIANDTHLWRWIRPDVIVKDPKRPSGWRLSSQAFEDSSDGTPCSVAIRAETWTVDQVLARFPAYAIAQIEAGQARLRNQRVLRWPDEMPGHAYIAGNKSQSIRKALAADGRWLAGGRNWDSPTAVP